MILKLRYQDGTSEEVEWEVDWQEIRSDVTHVALDAWGNAYGFDKTVYPGEQIGRAFWYTDKERMVVACSREQCVVDIADAGSVRVENWRETLHQRPVVAQDPPKDPRWALLHPYWDVPVNGLIIYNNEDDREREIQDVTVGDVVAICQQQVVMKFAGYATDATDLLLDIELNSSDETNLDYMYQLGNFAEVPIPDSREAAKPPVGSSALEDRVAALEQRLEAQADQITAALKDLNQRMQAIRTPIEQVRFAK